MTQGTTPDAILREDGFATGDDTSACIPRRREPEVIDSLGTRVESDLRSLLSIE
jgi:hypothetical protein